jgi:hypothetical protein
VQAAATLLTMSLAWLGPLAVGFAFEHAGPTATVLAVATWVLGLAILAALAPALRHGPPEPPMVLAADPDPYAG